MIKKILILILFVQPFNLNGQNTVFEWVKSMGYTDFDEGSSITTDYNGNVYTTGYFGSTVDFDPNVGNLNLSSQFLYYKILLFN